MIRYSSLVVVLLAAACGGDGPCIVTPGCPPSLAVRLAITATTTHALVNGVIIHVNGGSAVQCDGNCLVGGGAGKYVLDIEAPGFQSAQRTVTVTSTSRSSDVYGPNGFEGKGCACEIVNLQSLDVALVPAS